MRHRKQDLTYTANRLGALSFPLGGIGTGQVAICGDGGLRQWQIFNNIKHTAHVPFSFFGASVRQRGSQPVSMVLQSDAGYDEEFEPAPLISDHLVPEASRLLLQQLPGVKSIAFTGTYPIAGIQYSIPESPVHISLQTYSPFVPLDPDDSGLPAVIFHFKLANHSRKRVDASILMSQQNAVGWDGVTEIDGIRHPGYGGNRNRCIHREGLTAIEMTNPRLPNDHPHNGQMLAAVLGEQGSVCAQWTELDDLWNDFATDGLLDGSKSNRPSAKGQTINAAIAYPVNIDAGAEQSITFLLAWYFPNR